MYTNFLLIIEIREFVYVTRILTSTSKYSVAKMMLLRHVLLLAIKYEMFEITKN